MFESAYITDIEIDDEDKFIFIVDAIGLHIIDIKVKTKPNLIKIIETSGKSSSAIFKYLSLSIDNQYILIGDARKGGITLI